MQILFHTKAIAEQISKIKRDKQLSRLEDRIRMAGGYASIREIMHGGGNFACPIGNEYYIVGERFISSNYPDYEVFCFFRIVEPDDPIKRGGQLNVAVENLHRGDIVADAELEKFLFDQDSKGSGGDDDPICRAPIPPQYAGWINPVPYKTAREKDPLNLVVYETKAWRNVVRNPGVESSLNEIHALISRFYCDEHLREGSGISAIPGTDTLFVATTRHHDTILCEYDSSNQDDRRLTLVNLFANCQKSALSAKDWVDKCIEDYNNHLPAYNKNKAYPGILLYLDEDGNGKMFLNQWLDIEKGTDDSTNLAMSDEEIDILKSLTLDAENLPTFINGPAGSGKSTILHYLFAHYMLQKHENPDQFCGKPLFLTLSESLLKKARSSITTILQLDPSNINTSVEDISDHLNDSFYPFRDLLRVILGPQRSEKYQKDKEVDFERFKDLLLNKSNVLGSKFKGISFKQGRLSRDISPELCWHLIRSYIKGFSAESFLSPEDFRALPRQENLFIDESAYQYIFKEIWPWYKEVTCAGDKGFWDQQDMAREVLDILKTDQAELPESMQAFTTIFCDEAQDLTGIELQIVQKMSCLVKYDLTTSSSFPAIPFAFAGDPLQTLNPSGFRWENLKANVYRNLIEPMGIDRSLRPQRLTFNYRSPEQITYLANLIQLSRKMLFDDPVRPQAPYDVKPGTPIYHIFDKDEQNPLTKSEISNFRGCIILLPCSEGREDEFVDRYNLLRQLKEADPNQVFMSVLTAKGLDIQHVVVFAFAEELFSDISFPECTDGSYDDIALSYALNKIYVAITRSTDQMLILDTKRGADNFWNRIDSQTLRQRYFEKLASESNNDVDEWRALLPKGELKQWDPGQAGGFVELEASKIEEQAKGLFEDARNQRSYLQMGRAANFYSRIGKDEEAKRCQAYAEKYRGCYHEAATLFYEIREWKEATKCYWDAREWRVLIEDAHLTTSKKQLAVAKFMNVPITSESLREFLIDAPEEDRIPDNDMQWRNLAARMCDFVGHDYRKNPLMFTSVAVLSLAKYLCTHLSQYAGCADAAFKIYVTLATAGEDSLWQQAEALQSKISLGDKDVNSYVDKLYAHRRPWPMFIRSCWRQGNYELCYNRWHGYGEKADVKQLDKELRAILFEVLVKLQKQSEAQQMALDTRDVDRLKNPSSIGLRGLNLNTRQNLQFYHLLLSESVPDWPRIQEVFASLTESCNNCEDINRLLDIVGNSPMVRTEKPSDKTAIGLLNLLRNNILSGAWPRSVDDVHRAAAAFETIGLDKFLTDFGRTLTEHIHDGEFDEVAVKIFVRGKRHFYDREQRQQILADVRDKLAALGYQFEKYWSEAARPFKPFEMDEKSLDAACPIQSPSACFDAQRNCWILRQDPLIIEVTNDEIKIWNTNIRRSEVYVSRESYQVDAQGVPDSAGIGVSVETGNRVLVRHISWPVGVFIK